MSQYTLVPYGSSSSLFYNLVEALFPLILFTFLNFYMTDLDLGIFKIFLPPGYNITYYPFILISSSTPKV